LFFLQPIINTSISKNAGTSTVSLENCFIKNKY
jgi:hypothetical protein